jgi:hypothetical protein
VKPYPAVQVLNISQFGRYEMSLTWSSQMCDIRRNVHCKPYIGVAQYGRQAALNA